MINKGTPVRVYFNNGTIVEGFVDNWTDKVSWLVAENGNLMVIYNTSQNVTMIHLLVNSLGEEIKNESQEEVEELPKSNVIPRQMINKQRKMTRENIGNRSANYPPISPPGVVKEAVEEMERKYEFPNFTKSSFAVRSSAKTR